MSHWPPKSMLAWPQLPSARCEGGVLKHVHARSAIQPIDPRQMSQQITHRLRGRSKKRTICRGAKRLSAVGCRLSAIDDLIG
jgi:hypothetical protein